MSIFKNYIANKATQLKAKTVGGTVNLVVRDTAKIVIEKNNLSDQLPTLFSQDNVKNVDTLGKTVQAAIEYSDGRLKHKKDGSLTSEREFVQKTGNLISDISDIAQSDDVTKLVESFKEIIDVQPKQPSPPPEPFKVALKDIHKYSDMVNSENLVSYNLLPEHLPFKTTRAITNKGTEFVLSNYVNIHHQGVENIPVKIKKGKIFVPIADDTSSKGYKNVPFNTIEKSENIDILSKDEKNTLKSHKKFKNIFFKKTEKQKIEFTNLPSKLQHDDDMPNLSSISHDDDSTSQTNSTDSSKASKLDEPKETMGSTLASHTLNFIADVATDEIISQMTGKPKTLKTAVIVGTMNSTMNATMQTATWAKEHILPASNTQEEGTLLRCITEALEQAPFDIAGIIGGYVVKNSVYKDADLPHTTIDKRADIAKTLPIALAEFSTNNKVTPNEKGAYTSGQEMVLLATQAHKTLYDMIQEKQILPQIKSVGKTVGIDEKTTVSPIVADIKLVQNTAESMMKKITDLPKGMHTKALLTVAEKSLNLGIEQGLKVKTNNFDDVAIKFKDNILHIAIIDEYDKKNRQGYKYIPVNDFNEDKAMPLSKEHIDKFSLIQNMPKVLNKVIDEFVNNPELRTSKNKRENHAKVMGKIMEEIDAQKNNPKNMTYTQYISNIISDTKNVLSDAGQILIGEAPKGK